MNTSDVDIVSFRKQCFNSYKGLLYTLSSLSLKNHLAACKNQLRSPSDFMCVYVFVCVCVCDYMAKIG